MIATAPAPAAKLAPPKDYFRATDVAKMLRKALAEAWPGVKFSVRTGSASAIDVEWTDGPCRDAVAAIADRYAGAWFDGMTDYQGGHVLSVDGREAYFGSTFVFCKRTLSAAALRLAIREAQARVVDADGLTVAEYADWRGKPAARFEAPMGHCGQLIGADRRIHHIEGALATWFDAQQPPEMQLPAATTQADRVRRVSSF